MQEAGDAAPMMDDIELRLLLLQAQKSRGDHALDGDLFAQLLGIRGMCGRRIGEECGATVWLFAPKCTRITNLAKDLATATGVNVRRT